MERVKSISTAFNGITFRSRLEARWAMIFDALSMEYRYEYEGFDLNGTWYLPDFWIPSIKTWVEIKPTSATAKEQWLCEALALQTQNRVILFQGLEVPGDYTYPSNAYIPQSDGLLGYDYDYMLCHCPICKRGGIEYEGRGARICGDKCCPDSDRGNNPCSILMQCVFDMAIKYQFSVWR